MKNTTYSNYYYLCIRKRYKPLKRSNNETNYIFVSNDARDHRKFWS